MLLLRINWVWSIAHRHLGLVQFDERNELLQSDQSSRDIDYWNHLFHHDFQGQCQTSRELLLLLHSVPNFLDNRQCLAILREAWRKINRWKDLRRHAKEGIIQGNGDQHDGRMLRCGEWLCRQECLDLCIPIMSCSLAFYTSCLHSLEKLWGQFPIDRGWRRGKKTTGW